MILFAEAFAMTSPWSCCNLSSISSRSGLMQMGVVLALDEGEMDDEVEESSKGMLKRGIGIGGD